MGDITTTSISSSKRELTDEDMRYCLSSPFISESECMKKQQHCEKLGGIMSWVGPGCKKASPPTLDGGCVCGKKNQYCNFHCEGACNKAKKWCIWDDVEQKCQLRKPSDITASPVIFNNPTCIKPPTPQPTK
jgi:hypothetical protein